MRNVNCFQSSRHQRGIVTVVAAILLFAAVLFVLSQTYGIIGNTSNANLSQGDSTAAFFLAESGLERGQQIINSVPIPSSSTCKGITGTYLIGAGKFTVSASSNPDPCDSSGSTTCSGCTVSSTGVVGSSYRTIKRNFNLGFKSGVAGQNPTALTSTVAMSLSNKTATPQIALFNLSTRRQGNNTDTTCNSINVTGSPPACAYMWKEQSSNGGGASTVLGLGAAATIPAGGTATISQTMLDSSGNPTSERNFAEVGGLFPAIGVTAPNIIGSYWNDLTSGGSTAFPSGTSGSTNNGAKSSASACSSTSITNSSQSCTKWCYQDGVGNPANTLVFGYSGRSNTPLTSGIATVSFGPTNASLTRLAKFPLNSNDIAGTNVDVFSEIWYLQRNSYMPANYTGNASSGAVIGAIGATVTASVGAEWSGKTATKGSNFVTIPASSITSGYIFIGDTVNAISTTCPGLAENDMVTGYSLADNSYTITTAAASPAGCSSGAAKKINFKSNKLYVSAVTLGSGALENNAAVSGTGISGSVTTGSGTNVAIIAGTGGTGWYNFPTTGPTGNVTVRSKSTILTVASVTAGSLYVNDIVSGTDGEPTPLSIAANTNIDRFGPSTSGGAGTYILSGSAQHIDPATLIKTTTITLSSALPLAPTAGTAFTISASSIGTGQFLSGANTVVGSATTLSFKVSSPPSIALLNATICDGICALFDHQTTNTNFNLTGSNLGAWAAGFMCLSNAGVPTPLTSSTVTPTTWQEPVQ